jgi:hypothetical protein
MKEGTNEISALPGGNPPDSFPLCKRLVEIGPEIVLLTFGTLRVSASPFFFRPFFVYNFTYFSFSPSS